MNLDIQLVISSEQFISVSQSFVFSHEHKYYLGVVHELRWPNFAHYLPRYLPRLTMLRICFSVIRDHPCTTSACFWPFWTPTNPTYQHFSYKTHSFSSHQHLATPAHLFIDVIHAWSLRKNMYTVDFSTAAYLSCLFNVVCEWPLIENVLQNITQ